MNTENQEEKDRLLICGVGSSVDVEHEKWLKKFNKSKEGRLFNLMHDVKNDKNIDTNTHLASIAWIMAENTRFENDVKIMLQKLSPTFFNTE